jgi:hypothetical protein
MGLIDATDNFAVRKHVEITVVPLAGWPTKGRPDMPNHGGDRHQRAGRDAEEDPARAYLREHDIRD